jgi:GTPase SAR1 family protein
VGKTSIIKRATTDIFDNNYTVTLAVEYAALDCMVEGKLVRLNIWDTVRKS